MSSVQSNTAKEPKMISSKLDELSRAIAASKFLMTGVTIFFKNLVSQFQVSTMG